MTIFKLVILSSFFVIALFVTNSHSGNVYYVDGTNGNDHDNDGSCKSPWRTIDKANKKLEPGDIVYIKAGIYQQTIKPENSGTEGNYIAFSRYNCDNVIIKHVDTAVDLNGKSYIIIDGLKIGFVNQKSSLFHRRNSASGPAFSTPLGLLGIGLVCCGNVNPKMTVAGVALGVQFGALR